MSDVWYSVRMRAVREGRHLSGAERIGRSGDVEALVSLLTGRAMSHVGGIPDRIRCTMEKLDAATIRTLPFPDVRTWRVAHWHDGRALAAELLNRAGISPPVARFCIRSLAAGPAPGGGAMRGAMVVDATSGQRLEPDAERGVRASHMDVHPEDRPVLEQVLGQAGLTHPRVLEALVLSGKVLKAPGLLAELCWSDAPDYLSGYVATPDAGYQRISHLKEPGSFCGGRVFLVDTALWRQETFFRYLEETPVLMRGCPVIHPPAVWTAQDA